MTALWLQDLLQFTLDGLVDGGIYALVGLGLCLSFITLRRMNLAYGATAMLGAYIGLWAQQNWGLPVWLMVLLTVAATVLVGAYVERLCFAGRTDATLANARGHDRTALQSHDVVAMASSFAIWMQLEQVAVNLLPQHLQGFPSLAAHSEWSLGPWFVRPDRLALSALGMALCLLMARWISASRTGLAWRATTQQATASHLVGMPVAKLQRHGFWLASALSAVAALGVLLLDGQVTPMFGMWMLLKGLVATLLFGGNSLYAVLWGGLLLGQVEAHAQWVLGAQGREFAMYALLLLMLVTRRPSPSQGAHA